MRNSVLRALLVLALGAGLGAVEPGHAAPAEAYEVAALTSLPPWPTQSSGGFSLQDALPSPTPNRTLPSMPPEAAGTFVFYEDFEKGLDAWTVRGFTRGVGLHRLKAATCGGLFTMVLGEARNPPTRLAANESVMTLKKAIDLGKARHPQLQFDVRGDIAPPEAAAYIAEGRAPGGRWEVLAPTATARFPLVATFTADLTRFAGRKLELRFRGITKPVAHPSKGFYLDDVMIVEPNRR